VLPSVVVFGQDALSDRDQVHLAFDVHVHSVLLKERERHREKAARASAPRAGAGNGVNPGAPVPRGA